MIKFILFLILFAYIPVINANENIDWNISQVSKSNHYKIDLNCNHPPTLSSFQQCTFTLSNKQKEKLTNAVVKIDGGMPTHQHGLPTTPQALWNEKDNVYNINGLKFSMPGEWVLKFFIDKTDNLPRDIVSINIKID